MHTQSFRFKPLQRVPTPGMLYMLLFCVITATATAQSIQNQSRYMFATIPTTSPLPYISIDTLIISGGSDDTIQFILRDNIHKNELTFLKTAHTIYLLQGTDSIPLYDYALEAGDSFVYYDGAHSEVFLVDSVRMLPLENKILCKHWYLHTLNSGHSLRPRLIWAENYGELQHGWDYRIRQNVHEPILVGICGRTHDLVYWNFVNIMLPDPEKTCAFDSIQKSLSIAEYASGHVFDLHPNPTGGPLIKSGLMAEFEYRILNASGHLVQSGHAFNEIPIGTLQPGLYQIIVLTETQRFAKMLMKL